MSVVSMKQLLEAGVHFGHQTRRWNPKMAPYIYTPRNGIYIIDLQKTVTCVEAAYNALKEITAKSISSSLPKTLNSVFILFIMSLISILAALSVVGVSESE